MSDEAEWAALRRDVEAAAEKADTTPREALYVENAFNLTPQSLGELKKLSGDAQRRVVLAITHEALNGWSGALAELIGVRTEMHPLDADQLVKLRDRVVKHMERAGLLRAALGEMEDKKL